MESLFLFNPKIGIDESILTVNRELDKRIFQQNQNLERLKLQEFLNHKKYQDELIYKINTKMKTYKRDLDDRIYQDTLANNWYNEYQQRMNDIAYKQQNNLNGYENNGNGEIYNYNKNIVNNYLY